MLKRLRHVQERTSRSIVEELSFPIVYRTREPIRSPMYSGPNYSYVRQMSNALRLSLVLVASGMRSHTKH